MRRILASLLLICAQAAAGTAWGQDDDRGFLTNFLQGQLSGLGREVRIDGFAGALSSRATFTRLTVADGRGVWLLIEDGAISWNRSALLGGRIEIAEMSAGLIDILRRPESPGRTLEARPFTLPELPVSVDIGKIDARSLHLGPEVLGQELVGSAQGQVQLARGEGNAILSVRRTDGSLGDLSLTGAFSNATGEGSLDILVREGPGGIAATALGLPGTPAAELALHGSGRADDFRADLALSTDAQKRLTGVVRLMAAADGRRSFTATLDGDISPLLAEDYRAFFGEGVALDAEGLLLADGGTELTRLVLETAGFDLSGRVSLSPERLPVAAALTLRLGLADGRPMTLPLAGDPVTLASGVARLRFDADISAEWTLEGSFGNIATSGLSAQALTLDGRGQVRPPGGTEETAGRIFGQLGFAAEGLSADNPVLDEAIGDRVAGRTRVDWRQGDPLRLDELAATAGDLELAGALALQLRGLDLEIAGDLALRAGSLGRFSGLADRPLSGSAEIVVDGVLLAISGGFDGEVAVRGNDISIDQPNVDRLLAGPSRIQLSVRRDEAGITLRSADLVARTLAVTGSGQTSSAATDLAATLEFASLADLDPRLGGSVRATASLTGKRGTRILRLEGSANGLRTGQSLIDPLLTGTANLAIEMQEADGTFRLRSGRLSNPSVQIDADPLDEAGGLTARLRISNLGLIVPDFSGPLSAEGTVRPEGDRYRVALDAAGPVQSSIRLAGTAARDLSAVDLTLTGQARLDILNRQIAPRSITGPVAFDLQIRGAPTLANLTGRLEARDGRLALPEENVSIEALAMVAVLAGGSARLDGSGRIRGGGSATLSGSVGLLPPHDADLVTSLSDVVFRRPGVVQSRLDGRVTLNGPVLGGAVIGGELTLRDTEITVAPPGPDLGFLPYIEHRGDSAAVRATRQRAGIGLPDAAGGRGAGAGIYGLDLVINAPTRVFVRGFGLDAELGGSLRLSGTTADMRPVGEIGLIRGRLALLGQRFDLDQGLVQLQGSLVPVVDFSALSDTESGTTTIRFFGPVDRPEFEFSSTSGLPEEEVIAELLFGSRIDNLSTFQLLQLANAIASLGGGPDGGFTDRFRRGFQLDDLDVVADEDGNASLRAGKYLNDRLYSEVTLGQDGKSKITLNLEVRPGLDVEATIGNEEQSGLGLLYSRDY